MAVVALLLPLAASSAFAQQTTSPKPTPASTSKAPAAKAPAATTKAPASTKAPATSKLSAMNVDQELRTFSNWVDDKLELNMATVRLDWGTIENDYSRMTKRLDGALDSLTDQSRREYLGQKARYKVWAAENGHPVVEIPLAGEERNSAVNDMQRKLLNTTAPINRAMASTLPDLYSRLIESTRMSHKRWLKTDWEGANLVLERLNARFEQVGTQLQLEDRVRIRTLQAEFRTMEKARDLRGILNGL